MTRKLAVVLALFGSAAPALRAQEFKPAAQRVAAAFQRQDVGVLGSQAARGGLSIDLSGERVGPFSGRQAATALKRFFDERETVSISLGNLRETGGDPRRGYVELNWVIRSRGSRIPERSTVVVALELDHDQWRITEIRLMR
jgi:hypothetical protein